MRRICEDWSLVAILVLLAVSAPAMEAQTADPDPARFDDNIAAFGRWDAKNSVPEGATLFVGSSSIVYWNTAEAFPDMTLINRGFGGSHISDVNHFIEETVIQYSPDVVLHYAGDNDTAAGKSSEQIFEDYQEFVKSILTAKPSTEILFISIKPSLSRWAVWPQMVETNELVRGLTAKHGNLHYVDVATPMIGADGEPFPELFVRDGLHMTPAGYDIWNRVVGDALARIH